MAALERAVAVADGQAVAVGVEQDLHLDVAAGLDVGLDEDGAVAEGRRGLGPGTLDLRVEVLEAAYDPHAAPAAARARLDEQGQIGLGGPLGRLQDGYAGGAHEVLGPDLRAHRLDRVGRRPEPDQTGVLDGTGEVGVLAEEAVARVHGLAAHRADRVDHPLGVEVGLGGRAARQAGRDVGLVDVGQGRVGVGVERLALDAEAAAGGEDAAGDLAAVGHGQPVDQGWTLVSLGVPAALFVGERSGGTKNVVG